MDLSSIYHRYLPEPRARCLEGLHVCFQGRTDFRLRDFGGLDLLASQPVGCRMADGALALDQAFKLLWIMMELGLEPDQANLLLLLYCSQASS